MPYYEIAHVEAMGYGYGQKTTLQAMVLTITLIA